MTSILSIKGSYFPKFIAWTLFLFIRFTFISFFFSPPFFKFFRAHCMNLSWLGFCSDYVIWWYDIPPKNDINLNIRGPLFLPRFIHFFSHVSVFISIFPSTPLATISSYGPATRVAHQEKLYPMAALMYGSIFMTWHKI